MFIELFLIVFVTSLIMGFVLRKIVRNQTINEMKGGSVHNKTTIEGPKYLRNNESNDYNEDAEYDSDGRRIR